MSDRAEDEEPLTGEAFLHLFERASELTGLLQEGQRYAQLLLEENRRLRAAVAELTRSVERGTPDVEARLAASEAERRTLIERAAKAEEDTVAQYNLFVSCFQLHSSLEVEEVTVTLVEILRDLVGAEEFGVFTLDEATSELVLMGGELSGRMLPYSRVLLGHGVEGRVASKQEAYRPEAGRTGSGPLLALPMLVKSHLIGVISIYRLLPQKRGLGPRDLELLDMLASQGAAALLAARLYQVHRRKLQASAGARRGAPGDARVS